MTRSTVLFDDDPFLAGYVDATHLAGYVDATHQPEPRVHSHVVAVYLVDKLYGGPEEGGWWYEDGTLIRTIRVYKSEEKALMHMRRMQGLVDRLVNKGRPNIGSVLSYGRYFVEVHDETAPEHYPARRPHYE